MNPPTSPARTWRTIEQKRGEAPSTATDHVPHEERPAGLVDGRMLLDRRGFLAFSGATAGAVGLSGCVRRPVENILPFSRAPEYVIPGVPLHYATVTHRRGDGVGQLVTSHAGRPTKIEGNPDHPSSLGAADLLAQIAILDLYDTDRSRHPAQVSGGSFTDSTFEAFDAQLDELVQQHRADRGQGLRFLVEPTSSPSFVRLRGALAAALPNARIHMYGSVNESNLREGSKLAFGQPLSALYRLNSGRQPTVVLSVDCDFLDSEPGAVRNARSFADGRRITRPTDEMNRLYVVESTMSVTGMSADHRLRLASSDVERYLLALARTLAERHQLDLGELARAVGGATTDGFPPQWIEQVAADLSNNRGRAPILVGSRQPPRVHALAHFLNVKLDNVGSCIGYVPASDPDQPDHVADLAELVRDMNDGNVRTLVMLGGNPVYDAPADLGFRQALEGGSFTKIHLSSHRDETSSLCDWHVPRAHYLETWGDQHALDGTVAIQQPLIRPLFGGRSELELLARIAGERNWRGYYVARKTLRERIPDRMRFEAAWRQSLHRGTVAGSARPMMRDAVLREADIARAITEAPSERRALGRENLEVVFVPDPKLFDGRHANNSWALECPDPVTKMVWDNPALISPGTAEQLGLRSGDVVSLSREGAGTVRIPVWVQPGHADFSLTLRLGWGRTHAGRYGSTGAPGIVGFDVSPLRTTSGFYFADGVRLSSTGERHHLVQTQDHDSMEGRPLALDAVKSDPGAGVSGAYAGLPIYNCDPEASEDDACEPHDDGPDFTSWRSIEFTNRPLWEEVDYRDERQWGMTIDLTACTGCTACVIACQAENNIPSVGKLEVARGRQMLWLRIDRYFVGEDEDEPLVALQPIACQQCEEAPCENVCPVNATSHTPEGLNDMVYNRCVGTRYCANNCPYKVRRFNYLDWHGRHDPARGLWDPQEIRRMQFNPNVTVRMRGVIEKCTYCVQRIQAVKIAARREQRELRDGDITPACAQTCPTQAITFGDLADPSSRVARLSALDRAYRLLAEVGTQPRTRFLGRIRNPNPAMFGPAPTPAAEGGE